MATEYTDETIEYMFDTDENEAREQLGCNWNRWESPEEW